MADQLLLTAWSSLTASQYALSVSSNNVANAGTEGYRRLSVTQSESIVIDTAAGSVGTGVTAEEAQRAFDEYIERMYLSEYAEEERWATQAQWLGYVENIVNQADESGVNDALAEYFQAWSDLAANPDDEATREALLGVTETLNSILKDMSEDLEQQVDLINTQAGSDVDAANDVIQSLADLNAQIQAHPNDTSLLNDRDLLIRELSGYMDVEVQYYDSGQVSVYLGSGQALVSGATAYEVKYEGPKAWSSLGGASSFDGGVYFEGSSSSEIVLEVVNPGIADGGAGAAEFKVSLDGGQTWLTDDSGDVILYTADDQAGAIEVDGVTIWLGAADDSSGTATGALAEGDSFTVMAKSGVYWYKNTSSFENITPLASAGGGDDDSRLTGGSLAGLFSARDDMIGEYREELDAFASTLIWETNFAFSQGAGLANFDSVTGTYSAEDTTSALVDSGLAFADELQSGGFSIALYDETTGESLGVDAVDFSSVTPGLSTFDPTVHTLEDVAQAINDTFSGDLTATVTNGVLSIDGADGVEFQFAGDTTGILAACGINTYFTGSDASDIAINPTVLGDSNRLNAGKVDASGEVADGGNEVADAIAGLADEDVEITTLSGSTSTKSLSEYMNSLVSSVGSDSASAQANESYSTALADSLAEQQESASGVNLDEELVLIEQYQRQYQAASQMIEISNEMFDTLLGIM